MRRSCSSSKGGNHGAARRPLMAGHPTVVEPLSTSSPIFVSEAVDVPTLRRLDHIRLHVCQHVRPTGMPSAAACGLSAHATGYGLGNTCRSRQSPESLALSSCAAAPECELGPTEKTWPCFTKRGLFFSAQMRCRVRQRLVDNADLTSASIIFTAKLAPVTASPVRARLLF